MPELNGERWPDSAVLIVSLDSAGQPVANRSVALNAAPIDSAGTGSDAVYGHFHTSERYPKPVGRISTPNGAYTDSRGSALFVLYPSSVSGSVMATASSEGAKPVSLAVSVGVPGLISLIERASDTLIGSIAVHTENHWVIPRMGALLDNLADTVYALYGQRVQYNDASLPLGGRFDLHLDWREPHVEHEVGRDVDFRTTIWDQPELDAIRLLWESLGGTVHDETDTNMPHYHLRYRGEP